VVRGGVFLVTAVVALACAATAVGASKATYAVGTIRDISARCAGQNAEVEQAVDSVRDYVYEAWIGCNGIGFARSTDGGIHFKRPIRLRQSGGGWDPSLAVAADGTVYASFMVTRRGRSLPVVLSSADHGASFRIAAFLTPRRSGNWGDREFIAAGADRSVYVTWDYGPSDANVKLRCYSFGSCAITGGQLDIVMQSSTDGGRTFGPMVHVSPHFPGGGADSAPLLVEPSGRIDVLYARYQVIGRRTQTLGPGYSYFVSSLDGGRTWTKPVVVGRSAGTLSPAGWWIDGALGIDPAGNLYATWDTASRTHDIGWLAYSSDHGVTWSRPIRVSPDSAKVPHIVQVAGGPAGIAYVAWLSHRPRRGYAEYLRTFSITRGWLSPPQRITRRFGARGVWPGDTFGISTTSPGEVVLSWGSAIRSTHGNAEIFAAPVAVTLPATGSAGDG
jgi:hypothetical protein